MLELKLMNFLSKVTKEVEVEENSLVVINVVTGDWVMVEPFVVDTDKEGRLIGYYDGTVKFLATPENVDKLNAITYTYDIFDVFAEEELNEGWE